MKSDPDQSSRVYPPPHSVSTCLITLNSTLSLIISIKHIFLLKSSRQFSFIISLQITPAQCCDVRMAEKGGFICPPGRHCSGLSKGAPGARARAAATSWLTEFNWQEGKGYGLRDVTAPTVRSFPHQAIEVSSVAACYEIRCRLCKNKMMIINIHHVN